MANLVRWEPYYNTINRRRVMDHLLANPWRSQSRLERYNHTLAMDVYETKDAIVIKATAPGVKAEDLDINVTGDTLTIHGETVMEEQIEEVNYLHRERTFGSFYRSLQLPSLVVADNAEAVFENGILTLTLPKVEEAKPKTIEVKAKKKK